MFRLMLMIVITFSGFTTYAQEDTASHLQKKIQYAAISFDSLIVVCDTIHLGNVGRGKFQFTNTGNAPLIIENVQSATDDCVTDYSKEPVKPGKGGFIYYKIGPSGNPRKLQRYLTVRTNASEKIITLKVIGYIVN